MRVVVGGRQSGRTQAMIDWLAEGVDQTIHRRVLVSKDHARHFEERLRLDDRFRYFTTRRESGFVVSSIEAIESLGGVELGVEDLDLLVPRALRLPSSPAAVSLLADEVVFTGAAKLDAALRSER